MPPKPPMMATWLAKMATWLTKTNEGQSGTVIRCAGALHTQRYEPIKSSAMLHHCQGPCHCDGSVLIYVCFHSRCAFF